MEVSANARPFAYEKLFTINTDREYTFEAGTWKSKIDFFLIRDIKLEVMYTRRKPTEHCQIIGMISI